MKEGDAEEKQRGETKYYFSNLPSDTPLQRLASLAHSRWTIEQFHENAKGECGLGGLPRHAGDHGTVRTRQAPAPGLGAVDHRRESW
jgi:hypothetical protein